MPEPAQNLLPQWPWWLGRHPLLALTAALVIWGLVDVRARGRIDPENLVEHRTDLTVYTGAGAAFFDGRDPYSVTNARGWAYLYPPLFAILIAPLAALGPQAQVTIWFFLSLALLWGCYRETTLLLTWLASRRPPGDPAGETGPRGRLPDWLPWATAIAALLPTLNCLQRGQVGILQLYLLLVGFRLLLVGDRWTGWRSAAAGLILALAVVIKVTPALPVGLLLIERLAAAGGPFGLARRRAILARSQPRGVGTRSRTSSWVPRGYPRSRVGGFGLVCEVSPGAGEIGASGGAMAARRQIVGCSWGLVVGLALWLIVLPAGAIGWQRNLDCLARWSQLVPTKAIDLGHDLSTGDAYSVRNQSLVNAARHLGNWIAAEALDGPDSLQPIGADGRVRAMDGPWIGQLLLAVRLAVVGWLMFVAVRIGRRRDALASAALFGLGLAATLVVSPVARTHYFLLLAPAVLLVPWHLHRQGHARLAWWLAWTPSLLVVPHYFVPLAAGRVGWLGLGITAWLVAASVALCKTGRSAADRARAPETHTGTIRDRFASRREAAASCAAGGFDPSES